MSRQLKNDKKRPAVRLLKPASDKHAAAKAHPTMVSLEMRRVIQAAVTAMAGCEVHIRAVKLVQKPAADMPWTAESRIEIHASNISRSTRS